MRRSLLLLVLCLAVFFAALGIRLTLVPDVVAVAYAEGPQSVWALETAFLLRSVENVALAAGAIVLVVMAAGFIARRRRPSTRPGE